MTDEETAAAQQVLALTVRDRTYRIAAGIIPIRVKERFELETKVSVEFALSSSQNWGEVQFGRICYLSRLLNGEPNLRWSTVMDEWPEGLTADDIDFKLEQPEGDDPEA